MSIRDSKPEPTKPSISEPESFGKEAYDEATKQVKENGASIAISVIMAVVIWIFGNIAFIPIAEDVVFYSWPLTEVISFIIIVALAIIILRIFWQIRGLTDGLGGVLAYELGKAAGEIKKESYEHYRDALRGIMYVAIAILAYLLFASYLAYIHPALAAVVLILIVVWSILSIWRAGRSIISEIRRATKSAADMLEKK